MFKKCCRKAGRAMLVSFCCASLLPLCICTGLIIAAALQKVNDIPFFLKSLIKRCFECSYIFKTSSTCLSGFPARLFFSKRKSRISVFGFPAWWRYGESNSYSVFNCCDNFLVIEPNIHTHGKIKYTPGTGVQSA